MAKKKGFVNDLEALLSAPPPRCEKKVEVLDYIYPKPQKYYCANCGQIWNLVFGDAPHICDHCREAGKITPTLWLESPPILQQVRQGGATPDGQMSLF